MSLATGASGVQLGPRALALAADLNKGLSMRKTYRLAAKVKPQYDAIAAALRQAPVVHSDETSWWVAGPGWWLWVFATQLLTFYVVAQSRGRELLNDILGKDFGGVLVSDCLAIYDDATALQLIKPSAKPKTFTRSRARASYAKWRPCCARPSHSRSKKLSSVWIPSVRCAKPWCPAPRASGTDPPPSSEKERGCLRRAFERFAGQVAPLCALLGQMIRAIKPSVSECWRELRQLDNLEGILLLLGTKFNTSLLADYRCLQPGF
jgi:Transposase IS66 family